MDWVIRLALSYRLSALSRRTFSWWRGMREGLKADRSEWPARDGSFLSRFLNERDRLFLALHDFAGDDALPDLLLSGQRVHQIEHQVLDDHAQAAGADLPRQRRLGDRLEGVVREAELHVLVLEQLLVLARDRIARLRQDLDQRGAIELVQRADHRQPPDELRNQAVLDQILRLDHLERGADVASGH